MGHGASGAQHSGKSARTRRIAPSSLKERFASAFSHNLQRKLSLNALTYVPAGRWVAMAAA